jgi:hypothetical protein
MKRLVFVGCLAAFAVIWVGAVSASTPGPDVKLTHDANDPGYVSEYTLATGVPYTDATLTECSHSRGRQNEPAVAIDPRDPQVVLGSSNDYCGVYNATADDGVTPLPVGPIWEGYYRSENGGTSYTSSLVPGYPDDSSPYGQLAKQQVRTASAGDPVIAWDAHGRAFFGAESSDDPAGTPKTFGDVWVARFYPATTGAHPDGKRFTGTTVVARGSSAPNLLGKFNDKTAIEADHNSDGRCDDFVYFAWSRFAGNHGGVGAYFVRSTDHGVTFSNPMKVSQTISDLQDPDIAVTGNDNVYVFFRSFASGRGHEGDAIYYVKSTDCGATFTRPTLMTTFIRNDATDSSDPEASPAQSRPDDPQFGDDESAGSGVSRDCGDFADHCESGYTFFRHDTQERATADQFDPTNEYVYVVFDATKPGTETPTGTSYYTVSPGIGGQAAIMFTRLDGSNGSHTTPTPIDDQPSGHQIFPDVSADNPAPASRGTVHAIWWDSRNDRCYSPALPIGNCPGGVTTASLDTWGAVSHDHGATWPTKSRISDVTSNPNYEQFDNRSVPFAGDYLYVSSLNDFSIGTWTDWRDTRQGTDPREAPEDEDAATADVFQVRTFSNGTWSGDTQPRAGGLDQNIYGDLTP